MKKVALVTGSSRGIGAATAIHLAGQGYDICINYVENETAANILVDKIRKTGRNVAAIKADISKEEEVIGLFKAIDSELGRVTQRQTRPTVQSSFCSSSPSRTRW